jgi:simple sugar transport system permease protein
VPSVLELFESLLSSTLEAAPALVFAAMGAVLSERAGVVNVGVEGMMRVGAFAAAVAALSLPTPLAVLVGMAAGAAAAGVHALLCILARADQIVSGMAINLVALAGVTFLLESSYGPSGTPPIAQLTRWHLPLLEGVPLLRALSGHSALTPLALLLPLALQGLLTRTPAGLRVRAVGEKPEAAATLGLSVRGLRAACVVAGGLLAGLGGAALSTATLDRFEQHMPAGLGFMAVAAMVFGRWSPLGAAGAALFFAAGNALRISLGTSAPALMEVVPQGVLMALPYLLTLGVLAVQGRKTRPPAALGVPYAPEER